MYYNDQFPFIVKTIRIDIVSARRFGAPVTASAVLSKWRRPEWTELQDLFDEFYSNKFSFYFQ